MLVELAYQEDAMPIRRLVSAVLLMAYLPACTSFQATTQPLSELTAPPRTVKRARITTTSGARIELSNLRVANDTLYGEPEVQRPEPGPMGIALADVQAVEVRKADGTKTAILVGSIVAATVIALVSGSNDDCFTWPCP